MRGVPSTKDFGLIRRAVPASWRTAPLFGARPFVLLAPWCEPFKITDASGYIVTFVSQFYQQRLDDQIASGNVGASQLTNLRADSVQGTKHKRIRGRMHARNRLLPFQYLHTSPPGISVLRGSHVAFTGCNQEVQFPHSVVSCVAPFQNTSGLSSIGYERVHFVPQRSNRMRFASNSINDACGAPLQEPNDWPVARHCRKHCN
jgi:hypothetical protein